MFYFYFRFFTWMSKSMTSGVFFCLDLAKAGHSKWKCWADSISSSFKRLMKLATGKIFKLSAWNPFGQCPVRTPTTTERWTLLRANSSLDLLRFIHNPKVLGNVQLMLPNSLTVYHKKPKELLPFPFPQLLRLKCLSQQTRQPTIWPGNQNSLIIKKGIERIVL